MFDSVDTATIKAVVTLLILAAAMYGFVSERFPPDVTALLALLSLLLTGILTPYEAFSGFSHPATISVAAVLVLSAGVERTGALTFIARRLLTPFGNSELSLTVVIMVIIGAISAFINNTAAVAVFIPVVIEVCRRTSASPSRVLMPMSHAATFGGMCTLVGTSTNLVAHEFAISHGLRGFSMFELGKVGFPMLVAGFAYMLFVGRKFLPRTQPDDVLTMQPGERYLAELIVEPDSSWIGTEVNAAHFERDFDVDLIGVLRAGQTLPAGDGDRVLAPYDSLLVRGTLDQVLKLTSQTGLVLQRPRTFAREEEKVVDDETQEGLKSGVKKADGEQKDSDTRPQLAEVVVLTTSGLVGRTLKAARFADTYDAVVLALRRRGEVRERPSLTPLLAGDMLLVEGKPDALQALAETRGFLVVGTPAHPEQRPGKLVITIITLMAVVLVVSFGVLPIVTAATAGCVVLMLTGCLRPNEAYRAIDLSLVFILAGSLALGTALNKTGITTVLADWLAGVSATTGPFLVMAGFFVLAVVISELMSNSGTVALLGPITIAVATKMGINPMSLLAAITFGSSAAFAMPIGYQTSLMIYGPGGYHIKDFILMGIPLDLILAILALLLIPYFWPFDLAR
ncbi:MAG TPA: SLC13 family permease [Pyrinomonadaceae bacterium]|nr:SLC13 family permease [Pyrinomonadaceae bacterium]